MAERIFVSYRRSDSRPSAGRLYESLSQRFGDSVVFKDVSDIPVGANFREEIDGAVRESAVMIVVIGPEWVSGDRSESARLHRRDDHVRLEIELALELGVPLFPVLVDGAHMPDFDHLPPSIAGVALRNAAVLDHDTWSDDLKGLFRSLEPLIEGPLFEGDVGFVARSRGDYHRVEPGSVWPVRWTLLLSLACLIGGVVAGRLSNLAATVAVGVAINLLTQVLQGVDLRPLIRAVTIIPIARLRDLLLRWIPAQVRPRVELAGHRLALAVSFLLLTTIGILGGRASTSDAFDLITLDPAPRSTPSPPTTATSALAPGLDDDGGDYVDYDTIADDTGSITIEVPAVWDDRDTRIGSNDLPQLAAAPLLEGGFLGTSDVPGVQATVGRLRAASITDLDTALDMVLDGYEEPGCTSVSRTNISFPLPGRVERFADCDGGDTRLVHIAYFDEEKELTAVVRIQIVENRDDRAVETMLSSLQLQDNLPE